MKHHLVTAAILSLALMLYGIGMRGGGLALLAAGVACEWWFWVHALRAHRPQHTGVGTSHRG